jgi:hypothetical protein
MFPFYHVANRIQRSIRHLPASFLLLTCVTLLCHSTAQAQFNCPAPWDTATNVYGIVTLDGSGSGSSGNLTETVNQHAIVAGKLVTLVQGSCAWQAIPFAGLGQMKSQATENDTVTDTVNGNFETWSASGAGDPMWDNISLSIIPFTGQYTVGAFGAVPGQLITNSGTTNEDIIWGATIPNCGVSEPNQPFPPSAPFLFGTASYQAPPCDNAQGGEIANATWNVSWMFTPIPDGECKDCQDKRGSAVSTRNQVLGEDIPIVGTGFSLHYESDRSAGRAGADLVAIKDAKSLGGWTLSVHHVLEPPADALLYGRVVYAVLGCPQSVVPGRRQGPQLQRGASSVGRRRQYASDLRRWQRDLCLCRSLG